MVRTAVALEPEVEFVVAKVLKLGNARRRGARFSGVPMDSSGVRKSHRRTAYAGEGCYLAHAGLQRANSFPFAPLAQNDGRSGIALPAMHPLDSAFYETLSRFSVFARPRRYRIRGRKTEIAVLPG